MNKFELFWSSMTLILMIMLMSFMIFVAYIYYDAAMTMRSYAQELSLKNNHLKKKMTLNIDHDGWQDISFEEIT